MNRRSLELTGWLAFAVTVAGIFLAVQLKAPAWVADGLMALTILIMFPTMFLALRRHWSELRSRMRGE